MLNKTFMLKRKTLFHIRQLIKRNIPFIKCIRIFFFSFIIYMAFEEEIIGLFNLYILRFLDIKTNIYTNILFITICIFLIRNLYFRFKVGLYNPLFTSCSFTFVLIYLKYRFTGLYFYLPCFYGVGYMDILILLLLIFIVFSIKNCLCYNNVIGKGNIKFSFIDDNPIEEPYEDCLGYDGEAQKISKMILDLTTIKTISIGIVSAWGTGKSSFINLIKYYIMNSAVVVSFNPRHSKKSSDIQEDFFALFYSELKKYIPNYRLFFRYKCYVNALNLSDRYGIFKTLYSIYKIYDRRVRKSNIDKLINSIDKKIVIFIEDFDRLTGDEILEVFKLIDDNADFANTVFITAYDKKHVAAMLNKNVGNEGSNFSDKFFNCEIYIPIRPYSGYFSFFEDKLFDRLNIDENKKLIYHTTFISQIELFRKYIPTIRDIKRFLNMFFRDYDLIRKDVDFNDYILLSLIKYKYPQEHKLLYNKEYFDDNTCDNKYILKKDLREKNEVNSIDILELLFPKEGESMKGTKYRSICRCLSFEIYFCNAVYETLSLEEMNNILHSDALDKAKIDKWLVDSSSKELRDFKEYLSFQNILSYDNKDYFKYYVDCLFYINNADNDGIIYRMILKLLYETTAKAIESVYNYTYSDYKEIMKKYLEGEIKICPIVLKNLLIDSLNNELEDNIIFTNEDIQGMAYYSLKKYSSEMNKLNENHLNLLRANIFSIDPKTRKVTLYKGACDIVHKLIVKSPEYYFDNFVGLGSKSSAEDYNDVACDGFWEQIFGDETKFQDFISEDKWDDIPSIKRVRNFWELYKNNGYRPIHFEMDGNVKDKIADDLQNEIESLDKLKEIDNEIGAYEKNKTIKESEYQKLEKELENIKLYIELNKKIRDRLLNLKDFIKQ